jgi:hypothetical protein
MLTPDRVIAGKGKDDRSIRVPRANGTAFDVDSSKFRFGSVLAGEYLRQALEVDRILLGQCLAGLGKECSWIDADI